MKRRLETMEDTEKAARELYEELLGAAPSRTQATVVGLYGNLGAGKTAFTKIVAGFLGVADTVTSPTFVIEKIYAPTGDASRVFDHFIHIDAYRLESADELVHLGWNEIIANPRNLIFIEWPERVEQIMLAHTKVRLLQIDEDVRQIEIHHA